MIKSRLTAVLVVTAVLIAAALASYTSPILAQEEEEEDSKDTQTKHGSASSDPTGKPEDPNHWGDSASDFGNAGIMGDHSREGSAPGEAPFDEQRLPVEDTENGRVGVGNNDGDGPSGHAACVDGNDETNDDLCID
jgi:hypothetical protein